MRYVCGVEVGYVGRFFSFGVGGWGLRLMVRTVIAHEWNILSRLLNRAID